MPQTITYNKNEIWDLLKQVTDPEIPVLNIVEMGIARSIEVVEDSIVINITPTYSGCPAMAAIEQEIYLKMAEKGVENVKVQKDFSEAWTTEWMSDEAKQKLKKYGIAPPGKSVDEEDFLKSLNSTKIVPCPYCDSLNTELRSTFGSTACKALYYCHDCEEPFEHFKCI